MNRFGSLTVHAYSFCERSLEEDNLRVNGNCERLASLLVRKPGPDHRP